MERVLPTVNIEGTEFIVDVIGEELREKADPQNRIKISEMNYLGDGYSFDYDLYSRNMPDQDSEDFSDSWDEFISLTRVKLPELVALDPAGLAEKYKCSVDDIQGKTDFDLMIRQGTLHLRWNKGVLPVLDILGEKFTVDINNEKLWLIGGTNSQSISFEEIRPYFDRGRYVIPYNPQTHQVGLINRLTITELPKDLIAVEILSESELDRVGWNKKYGFDLRSGLRENEPKLDFKAKVIDWEKTNIPEHIKRNLEKNTGKQKIEKPQIKIAAKALPKIKKGRSI